MASTGRRSKIFGGEVILKGKLCGKCFYEIYHDADSQLMYCVAVEQDLINNNLPCPNCSNKVSNIPEKVKRQFDL